MSKRAIELLLLAFKFEVIELELELVFEAPPLLLSREDA